MPACGGRTKHNEALHSCVPSAGSRYGRCIVTASREHFYRLEAEARPNCCNQQCNAPARDQLTSAVLVPLELLSTVQPHATSLPSLTRSLIMNCVSWRPNCNGTFSAARPTSPQIPEADRRTVVVSLIALIGRWVVQRSTGRRLFFMFQS